MRSIGLLLLDFQSYVSLLTFTPRVREFRLSESRLAESVVAYNRRRLCVLTIVKVLIFERLSKCDCQRVTSLMTS